ncbi:hypothetical protein ACFFW8_05155 [Erwinia tracheiphila]
MLAHPRAVLGISGAVTESDHQLRTRANITLTQNDTLFAQYTMGNTQYQSSAATDIRYYRNITGGGSASLFWRSTTSDIYGHRISNHQQGDTWGASLSLRLPWSTSLIATGQYMDTAWRQGFASDVAVTTLARLSGRDMNVRVSGYDRPGLMTGVATGASPLGLVSLWLLPLAILFQPKPA